MRIYRAGSQSWFRPTRCDDGYLWRHDPQADDPYLETKIGKCPECEGNGCVTCPRCKVVHGYREDAECCEDFDCPMQEQE